MNDRPRVVLFCACLVINGLTDGLAFGQLGGSNGLWWVALAAAQLPLVVINTRSILNSVPCVPKWVRDSLDAEDW